MFFSFINITLCAQYGTQFDNRGFEVWTTRDRSAVEPEGWHSGGTATGTFAGFLSNQIAESSQTRPGSQGTKSVKIFPKSVIGVTANGNMTNGRMNAGNMSATGSGNYNYTQRAESDFNTPNEVIAQLSDANGDFENAIELGRITTDSSGIIVAAIPQVASGEHYRVRVISTNYPMIGTNEQEVSISDLTSTDESRIACTIYPNPASSEITVKSEQIINGISLFDLQGRLIISKPVLGHHATLNISTLPSGVYNLQIFGNGKKSTHRIVKR